MSNDYGVYNRQDIARASATSKAALRLGAKSTGLALRADNPTRIRTYGISTAEQIASTLGLLLLLIATGASWTFVPTLGAGLAFLMMYFTARRISAFSQAPLHILPNRSPNFWHLLKTTVPVWWMITSAGLILVSALYRSVVLEWIPLFIRDTASIGASAAILINFGTAFVIAHKGVREYRSELIESAETQAAIAVMLGGNVRALFEPSPLTGQVSASYFHARDGSIVLTPQPDVDLPGVAERLARTRLGQRYEVDSADYEQIHLIPISESTLERQRQRAQSGGLVEGSEDLTGQPTRALETLALDADDPWGETAAPIATTPASDEVSFGEGDWS